MIIHKPLRANVRSHINQSTITTLRNCSPAFRVCNCLKVRSVLLLNEEPLNLSLTFVVLSKKSGPWSCIKKGVLFLLNLSKS